MHKELYPGLVVEQNGERFTLIRREQSWREDDTPICVGSLSNERQIVHAKQRWLVDIDGFRTHRYVEYYVGRGHISANCPAWNRLND